MDVCKVPVHLSTTRLQGRRRIALIRGQRITVPANTNVCSVCWARMYISVNCRRLGLDAMKGTTHLPECGHVKTRLERRPDMQGALGCKSLLVHGHGPQVITLCAIYRNADRSKPISLLCVLLECPPRQCFAAQAVRGMCPP